VAAAPSLDITADDPLNQHGSGGPMSLREVLVGMIEEYARHMGYATCCASGSTDVRPVMFIGRASSDLTARIYV
jgi:hypothetical protein